MRTLATLALALLLTACGGGGDEAPTEHINPPQCAASGARK